MKERLRISGSSFSKLEKPGAGASRVVRRAGLPQAGITPRRSPGYEDGNSLVAPAVRACRKLEGAPFARRRELQRAQVAS